MNENNTRVRGIIGYKMLEEVGGPPIFGRYALLIRPSDGEMRMVHYEGVAYKVTDDKLWCWTDYDDTQKHWSPAELTELCSDDNKVDLADWVRVFGSRLESNFAQISWWYNSGIQDND